MLGVAQSDLNLISNLKHNLISGHSKLAWGVLFIFYKFILVFSISIVMKLFAKLSKTTQQRYSQIDSLAVNCRLCVVNVLSMLLVMSGCGNQLLLTNTQCAFTV